MIGCAQICFIRWTGFHCSSIILSGAISLALGRSLLVNYDGRRACRATLSSICIESEVDIELKHRAESETRFRVVQVEYKTSR